MLICMWESLIDIRYHFEELFLFLQRTQLHSGWDAAPSTPGVFWLGLRFAYFSGNIVSTTRMVRGEAEIQWTPHHDSSTT